MDLPSPHTMRLPKLLSLDSQKILSTIMETHATFLLIKELTTKLQLLWLELEVQGFPGGASGKESIC